MRLSAEVHGEETLSLTANQQAGSDFFEDETIIIMIIIIIIIADLFCRYRGRSVQILTVLDTWFLLLPAFALFLLVELVSWSCAGK